MMTFPWFSPMKSFFPKKNFTEHWPESSLCCVLKCSLVRKLNNKLPMWSCYIKVDPETQMYTPNGIGFYYISLRTTFIGKPILFRTWQKTLHIITFIVYRRAVRYETRSLYMTHFLSCANSIFWWMRFRSRTLSVDLVLPDMFFRS